MVTPVSHYTCALKKKSSRIIWSIGPQLDLFSYMVTLSSATEFNGTWLSYSSSPTAFWGCYCSAERGMPRSPVAAGAPTCRHRSVLVRLRPKAVDIQFHSSVIRVFPARRSFIASQQNVLDSSSLIWPSVLNMLDWGNRCRAVGLCEIQEKGVAHLCLRTGGMNFLPLASASRWTSTGCRPFTGSLVPSFAGYAGVSGVHGMDL